MSSNTDELNRLANLKTDPTAKSPALNALLCGMIVKADHPITCCNPEETFVVFDAQIDGGKLFLRGEETMWFGQELLTRIAT